MIDRKVDDKECMEIKNFHSHYLDKRKQIMRTIQIKVESILGDIIWKDNKITEDQIISLNNFSATMSWTKA